MFWDVPCSASSARARHITLFYLGDLSAWSTELDSSCSTMAPIQKNGSAVSLKIFRVQDKVFSSGINSQCIQRVKLIADYIICFYHVTKWQEIGASSSQRENLRDRHFSWSAGRVQNMDRGPWTTPWTRSMDHPMDLVHGPPLIFKRKSPLFRWKFTGGQGMKNTDSYFFINMPWLQICSLRVNFVYKINRLIFMHDRV